MGGARAYVHEKSKLSSFLQQENQGGEFEILGVDMISVKNNRIDAKTKKHENNQPLQQYWRKAERNGLTAV